MEKSPKREASKRKIGEAGLATYVSPAIIYEGRLTIRAGSPPPAGENPFDGPPSPFKSPGG
jgi:hypothetical protein